MSGMSVLYLHFSFEQLCEACTYINYDVPMRKFNLHKMAFQRSDKHLSYLALLFCRCILNAWPFIHTSTPGGRRHHYRLLHDKHKIQIVRNKNNKNDHIIIMKTRHEYHNIIHHSTSFSKCLLQLIKTDVSKITENHVLKLRLQRIARRHQA